MTDRYLKLAEPAVPTARPRDDLPKRLETYGFAVDAREPSSFALGRVQLVMRHKREFIGAADPRRAVAVRRLQQ